MTGQDIIEKTKRYISREPDTDLVIDAIQSAINWLGNKGYIIDKIDIEAEPDGFYEFPEDIIRVIKVEIPAENKYYYSYIIDGNLIRFQDKNEYRIFAEKHPFKYQNRHEEIPMHPMLQGCVEDYVKGYCKLSIDDTSQDGHRLIQEFKENSAKAYQVLKRGQKTPAKVRVQRHG